MQFQDMIGQSTLIAHIKHSIDKGRVVHAYIISGEKGSGKKMLAFILAKAMNCRSSGERPCDACPSCIQFNTENHPDMKILTPIKSKILIEQVRELQKDIYVKPYEAGKKVYIIENAESMTDQAQNCLLKTLEEPPASGILILLTARLEGLLPTIRSRCQLLKLGRVSRDSLRSFLIEKKGLEAEKAVLIARLSDGLVGNALNLATSADFFSERELVLQTVEKIVTGNYLFALTSYKFFEERKNNIEAVLDMMQGWFRDLLVWKETRQSDLLINCDRKDILDRLSSLFTLTSIQDIIERISLGKKGLKQNANLQLTMESLLLKIVEDKQKCSL